MEKVYTARILEEIRQISKDGSTSIELMKRLSQLNTEKRKISSDKKRKISSNKKRKIFSDKKRKISSDKKSKKIKKPKEDDLGPEISVDLREEIKQKGGVNIQLVIMKRITDSDLRESLNRLTMPVNSQVIESFEYLTEEEIEKLSHGGVEVKLIEPCKEVSNIKLKRWNMHSDVYVLTSGCGWNAVHQRKGNKELGVFKENNVIQVWCFRVNDELWFAINKVDVSASSSGREASSETHNSNDISTELHQKQVKNIVAPTESTLF
ncbi:hypothetical protein M5689_001739 [Euphorbia peplus]|nr:hypothetical protein M5689_001739 [Euphorbia peplus]